MAATKEKFKVTLPESVAFRDKAFKSRTIVFEDGSTLAVDNSAVVVSDEQQIVVLECHPDFERIADGS
ncbi:hypothetical protein PQQ75_01055 [Paraburkholderia aspalathi]|jgi:hypothetical protein|uniref:hypothetical protein n=1 Tax=Paraburkholderia aspalathi TaxID=1324617 RepID=UPI0038B83414